jgi:dihydrofolate reductase
MKCSVFIATSTDGYIATENGGIEWLETAGKKDVDMGDNSDMGFNNYIASVDCMIMGRKCMEKISSFNIPVEQWPYGNARVIALSSTVKKAPDNLHGKVEIYSGDLLELIAKLEAEGFKHAYIDGGNTVTSFIKLKLITDLEITRAPVLLGGGIPLFGKFGMHAKLEDAEATTYPNDFIVTKYKVSYS